MPDFTDLLSQAKKMQEKMKETQEAIKKIEVELTNTTARFETIGRHLLGREISTREPL